MIPCATADRLELLLGGALDDSEVRPLREHVSHCSNCQAALDRLSDHPQLR